MNVLIDIAHPAHVHMFRCFAKEMQSRGHHILVVCRDKDNVVKLLQAYGLPYVNLGKKRTSAFGKVLDLLQFPLQIYHYCKRFKADVIISHGSVVAAYASVFARIPHITMEDTFNMEQVRLYLPITKAVIVADYDNPLVGKSNVVRYAGYNELLYLHPNRFTPDLSVLDELGVQPGEKYVIVRFVSWLATHDRGHKGISYENKLRAVSELSKYAKVFISSEKELPEEFEKYRIPITPHRMHDAIAFSSLIFGESATMVSEGVVLGVPGIYIDNIGRLYTREQQDKFGMCFNYSESLEDQAHAIQKAIDLINLHDVKKTFEANHQRMIAAKTDATEFLINFVSNYSDRYNPRLDISFPQRLRKQFFHGKPYQSAKNEFLMNHSRSAIMLALQALHLPSGSGVGVMAYNCHTVMNAVAEAGLRPVFIDVTDDLTIDMADLQRKAGEIRALVVTHLFGIRNDVQLIREQYHDLPIIEDCAHAYGITELYGDFATFSIGQGKFPSLGDGGMLRMLNQQYLHEVEQLYSSLPDSSFLQNIRTYHRMSVRAFLYKNYVYDHFTQSLKKYGKPAPAKIHISPSKMCRGVSAIYAEEKTHILKQIEDRSKIAQSRAAIVSKIPGVERVIMGENAFMLVLVCNDVENVHDILLHEGIDSSTHFGNSIYWAKAFKYEDGNCPNTEQLINKLLMIPIYK